MRMMRRVWLVGVITALVAAAVTGCVTAGRSAPETLVMADELGARQSSWSWTLVSGSRDADPLAVGLERRPNRAPTLQAILYRRGDHLLRVPDLPELPGTPHAARAVAAGKGAVIVGAAIDDGGTAHTFVFESPDRRHWRAIVLSEELQVVPTAAAADGEAIYFAQGRSVWRVATAGAVAVLASPGLDPGEEIIGLALGDGRLLALARGREGAHARLVGSPDAGATWGKPTIVASSEVEEPLTPSGLLVAGSRVLVTGGCGVPGVSPQPCLASSTSDGEWTRRFPFGGAAQLNLVAPAINAREGILTAATSSRLSEGWPAELSSAGTWTGSRRDLVGSSVGTVLAVGAGVNGEGFLAIVRNSESTRMVLREGAAADATKDVESTIGGSAMSSWLRAPGSTWGPRSQLLEVRPTIRTASSGGYFVSPSSTPIGVSGLTVGPSEWRPALGRSRDAFVAETKGDTTVLAGSEPVADRTNLGAVHVYTSGAGGDWREVAADLAPRFSNQIATALISGREWVLATSPPASALATESSRLFRSADGTTWSEFDGPAGDAGTNSRVNQLCLLADDRMVAVGTAGPAAAAVWLRHGDSWKRLPTPEGTEPSGACASTESGVVLLGTGPSGAVVWKVTDDGLAPVDVAWAEGADVHGAVAVPGGIAVAGLADAAGLKSPTVWFSRDGKDWTTVRLGSGAGADADAFVTLMQKEDGVVVFSSAPEGLHGWKVRSPW